MLASLTTIDHQRLFCTLNSDSDGPHIRPTFDQAEPNDCLDKRGFCHEGPHDSLVASSHGLEADRTAQFPSTTVRRTDSFAGICALLRKSPRTISVTNSPVHSPLRRVSVSRTPPATSIEDTSLDEDDVGPLIQRRMELRRILSRLNDQLLALLHEEWTLTGRIPDGYEDLLCQMGRNTQPIKTTSYPLPRLLIRRASTLTRPLLDGSEHSTTSSLISGSMPWTVDSNFVNHPGACTSDLVHTVNAQDTHSRCSEQFHPTNDRSFVRCPSTGEPVSLDSGCSDTEPACSKCHVSSSAQETNVHSHQGLVLDNPDDDPACPNADEFHTSYQGDLSWTDDEDDIRRTAYHLQLRRLEVDHAVISQLHAVHKQRAIETKREAYRIAYKSNSRKLKEIETQMKLIKDQLRTESETKSSVLQCTSKFTGPRRKTWMPLRIPAPPQWALSTLPRRQSRFHSPEIGVRHTIDAYSTPVTPDRQFLKPNFDFPHKPPPSLVSISPGASRASSLASESASIHGVPQSASGDRFKHPRHPRPSLMPLFQFFRNSTKSLRSNCEEDNGLSEKSTSHPHTLPHPIVRSVRLRNSVASGKRVAQKLKPNVQSDCLDECATQQIPSTSVSQPGSTLLSNRSSLFFPHRQCKYTQQSTCSSFGEAEKYFDSPVSSVRECVYNPANDAKSFTASIAHTNQSLETTTATSSFRQPSPVGTYAGYSKLRRSLSDRERPIVDDPLRDSAIDLPDFALDSQRRCHQNHRSCRFHSHSVPDLTASTGSDRSLACCRRGLNSCCTMEHKRIWVIVGRNSLGTVRRPTELDTTKLSDLPGSSTTYPKPRRNDYASYSTSSFPPGRRLTCSDNANTKINIMRPAASNTSSSNWSTSGCSCLSSHTGGSTALSDSAGTDRPTLVASIPISATTTDPSLGSTDVPVVKLRNMEDRGRRLREATSQENITAFGSAIRVKCICSCLSEHAVHGSCTDNSAATFNGSTTVIMPMPVESLDGLSENRAYHHSTRQCIHSTDSCETTVAGSPIHTTSSSPVSSTLDLRATYPVEKAKSKTCGYFRADGNKGTFLQPETLTKGSSNRRSIRPLALLRRAVSKVTRNSTMEATPNSTPKRVTGPMILPSLITSRQVAMTETKNLKRPSVNRFHGVIEPRDGTCSSSSQSSCISLPGAVAVNDSSMKSRFMWSGKLRHSARCPR